MSATWLGPLCAFLASATWAVGSGQYAKLARDHTAFAVNFTRAVTALPIFVVVTFILGGGWSGGVAAYSEVTPVHAGWFTLSMFASYGIGDVLFLWSTISLGLSGALALASCYPLWMALFAVFFRGESLTSSHLAGLAITVFGVITVILSAPPERGKTLSGKGSLLSRKKIGVLLGLGTSFLWAINSFAVVKGTEGLVVTVANTLRMGIAVAMCAALSMVFAPGKSVILPAEAIRRVYWIFPIEACMGAALYTYGMSHSSLVLGSTLASLSPAIAVPVGAILGLEKLSVARTGGVIAVVTGVWLLMR